MAEATYIDCSGSVEKVPMIQRDWPIFYFSHEVSTEPSHVRFGGTNVKGVLDHAQSNEYTHIEIITDEWGQEEFTREKPT